MNLFIYIKINKIYECINYKLNFLFKFKVEKISKIKFTKNYLSTCSVIKKKILRCSYYKFLKVVIYQLKNIIKTLY